MGFQYSKLRGKIVEKFGSQKEFAKALNTSEVSVSNKMNGKTAFTYRDIEKWRDLLDIESVDVGVYFFA